MKETHDSWVFFWYSLVKLILSILILALVVKICGNEAKANVNLTILNSNLAAASANRIAKDIREGEERRRREREESMRLPCLTGQSLAKTSMTEQEVEGAVFFGDETKFNYQQKERLMKCFIEARK